MTVADPKASAYFEKLALQNSDLFTYETTDYVLIVVVPVCSVIFLVLLYKLMVQIRKKSRKNTTKVAHRDESPKSAKRHIRGVIEEDVGFKSLKSANPHIKGSLDSMID